MYQPEQLSQKELGVDVQDMTCNGAGISPSKKKLAVVFQPPRIIIRLIRPNRDGGPTEWKKCLKFELLHTWASSNDEAEQNKLLVVCGKERRDSERYLIEFPNALEMDKFTIILKLHGDSHLYKCVAERLPTTEAELRRVKVDASWNTKARPRDTMDPLGSINGVNPADSYGL